jgi:hypothetical protein
LPPSPLSSSNPRPAVVVKNRGFAGTGISQWYFSRFQAPPNPVSTWLCTWQSEKDGDYLKAIDLFRAHGDRHFIPVTKETMARSGKQVAEQIQRAKASGDLASWARALEEHHRQSAPRDESYGMIATAAASHAENAAGTVSVLVMGAAGGAMGQAIQEWFVHERLPAPDLLQVDLISGDDAPTSPNSSARIYGVDSKDNWPIDSGGCRVEAGTQQIVVARHIL